MINLESLGKFLLICGAALAAAGLLLLLLNRLGLGRLPGDIVIEKDSITFYFPLATMLLLSIILTIVINLFRR
jgi:hypothetical protein